MRLFSMIVVIITLSPQEMEMWSFHQEKNLLKNGFDKINDFADEASTELFMLSERNAPTIGQ